MTPVDSSCRLAVEKYQPLGAGVRVQDDALGFNLDTAWHFIQREYLPWSVYKLGDRLLHVHARDGDGLITYRLPPGMGVIDWHGLIEALRDVGYDGALSLEMNVRDSRGDPWYYGKWSLEYLKRVLAETVRQPPDVL